MGVTMVSREAKRFWDYKHKLPLRLNQTTIDRVLRLSGAYFSCVWFESIKDEKGVGRD
jgi:hypothetical protein